jgi:excisionase family DNA binding protein
MPKPRATARDRNRPQRPEPRWVTGLPAVAAYSGLPVRTLRDWIAKGLLPAYRIGPRQIQIDLNDIDRLRVRIPAANGGQAVVLPPLSREDIRAVARELAALQEADSGGEAAGAGQ